MVRALDAVPWKERQQGHLQTRNAIDAKQKLGLGVNEIKKNDWKGKKTRLKF